MARPLRIEFPGGLYHVTSRGDRREDIYLSDSDRQQWLDLFAQVCKRYNWACHAYCLMDNHHHATVRITVTAVNDAPKLDGHTLTAAEDMPVVVNLLAGI